MKKCQHVFQQNSTIPACTLCGELRSVVEAEIQQQQHDRGFEDALADRYNERLWVSSNDYVVGYKKAKALLEEYRGE